jgi:hypothetical protein
MVRVLLICVVVACTGGPKPATAPLSSTAPAVPEALWDHGTFVAVDKEKIDATYEEKFQIFRTATGYRLEVSWKRTMPTGEPADGTIELVTDEHFTPISGTDVMNWHAAAGVEVSRSSIRREPDGRITTEEVAADGKKTSNSSTARNDWFIAEQFTSFLNVMCSAGADVTSPTVYPDKATTLEPAQAMPIEGTMRAVTSRKLTYTVSKNLVIAACEDGKLAGEVTRGVTIVRTGDLALARELERRFR